jgi:hypothetical protein
MAGFDQKTLDAAAAKQRKAKERRKVAGQISQNGVRTHQIDSRLFHQGVAYGRRHGMDNAWDNVNFVQEMEKCHPDIVVEGIGGGCSPVSRYMLEQARKLVSRT